MLLMPLLAAGAELAPPDGGRRVLAARVSGDVRDGFCAAAPGRCGRASRSRASGHGPGRLASFSNATSGAVAGLSVFGDAALGDQPHRLRRMRQGRRSTLPASRERLALGSRDVPRGPRVALRIRRCRSA